MEKVIRFQPKCAIPHTAKSRPNCSVFSATLRRQCVSVLLKPSRPRARNALTRSVHRPQCAAPTGVRGDKPGASRAPKPSSSGEVLVWGTEISKSHDGDRILFSDLSVTISRGDRVAIVGPNGCGKSSLLRLLAGSDLPDNGEVQLRKGVRVSCLEQEMSTAQDDVTVLEAVLSSSVGPAAAVREYEAAATAEAAGTPQPAGRLEAAINKMEDLQAWALHSEARRVLDALRCKPTARVASLSGGQRRRVELAAALLSDPDVLVLDEPTNHMDLDIIRWMESTLVRPDLTLLFISHDRRFMEAVATSAVELDEGRGFVHPMGGEGSYARLKQLQRDRRAAQAQLAANAATVLRKEAEWMSRQPKARSTKSRARIDAFYDLQKVAASAPKEGSKVQLGGGMARMGTKVLALEGAAVAVGGERAVFKDFSFQFGPGDRLAIVGANGAGKSSLLKALAGHLDLQEGTREVGETVRFGFLMQEPPRRAEDDDQKLIDYLSERAELAVSGSGEWEQLQPAQILERVGFPRPRQQARWGQLSGGERRRVHLAEVLVGRPNFLLLDEPTNDLDLETIEVLEAFLADYQGTLCVVSHDRAFVDSVCDRLLVMEGDERIQGFDGSYEEYLAVVEAREAEQAAARRAAAAAAAAPPAAASKSPSAAAPPTPPPNKKKKLSNYERKEYNTLEGEIDELSEKLSELGDRLAKGADDYSELAQVSEEMGKIEALIDKKTDRWLELAERAE